MKVGLIGLGNAGLALATPILKIFEVTGYDRNEVRRDLAQGAGVQIASSAGEVAEHCEVIFLSLPDPAISKTVLGEIGRERLAGRLVVETSTVAPQDIAELSEIAQGGNATVMVVLVEAGALAAAQDVPVDVFYELMRRESGLMRPLTHRFGEFCLD